MKAELDLQNKETQQKIIVLDKATFRKRILDFEKRLDKYPGSAKGELMDKICPLKHSFVEGAYIREMYVPTGILVVTKIHKCKHPYFVMKGDCSILTEKGVVRVKAPYWGITEAGTKRIVYVHEETIWVTVHVTKHKDLKDIEDEIIAKSFDEIEEELLTEENIKLLK